MIKYFSENLPVTLEGKIPRPKHSPSSEYDFIDSQSLNDGRYTDLGKNLSDIGKNFW